MTDFRNLQHYIAQIRVTPSPEEFYLEGYTLLRHCHAEAQAVLTAPFNTNTSPGDDLEQQRILLKAYEAWETRRFVTSSLTAQLFRVLLDASIRRFRCQRIYLRATAAMRWINSRNDNVEATDPSALQGVDNALHAVSTSPSSSQGAWLRRTLAFRSLQVSRTTMSSTASDPRTWRKGNGSTRTQTSQRSSSTSSRSRHALTRAATKDAEDAEVAPPQGRGLVLRFIHDSRRST